MRKSFEIGGAGDGTTNDLAAHEQPLATGSRVELHRHLYGHVAGAQGVVVRAAVKGQSKVVVRFDDTGYQISVPPEALKPLTSLAPPLEGT